MPSQAAIMSPETGPAFEANARVITATRDHHAHLAERVREHTDAVLRAEHAETNGESLIMVNDHGPKPQRYRARAMWPDRDEWTYLGARSTVWPMEIKRAG